MSPTGDVRADGDPPVEAIVMTASAKAVEYAANTLLNGRRL